MDYSNPSAPLLSKDASPAVSSPPPYYPAPSAYPQNYYPPQGPGMHPPYSTTPGGQPYYHHPGTSYPGSQQQQQVVVVGSQPAVTPVIVSHGSPVSFGGAIVLSCLVFWFCGWLFGGIAFILALVGQSYSSSGEIRSAIQLRNASYGLSVVGIVCGIIIIAVAASMFMSSARRISYYRQCYNPITGLYYVCSD